MGRARERSCHDRRFILGVLIERIQGFAEQGDCRRKPTTDLVNQPKSADHPPGSGRIACGETMPPCQPDVVKVLLDSRQHERLVAASQQRKSFFGETAVVDGMRFKHSVVLVGVFSQLGFSVLAEQLVDCVPTGVWVRRHQRFVGQGGQIAQ